MSRGRITLLVVDPDPDVVGRIGETIRTEDPRWDVESAKTVRAARDRLENGGVDCVVSAHRLSDGTGLEFLQDVREDGLDVSFVLFPTDGSEAVVAEAIEADVTAYVPRDSSEDPYETVVDRVDSHVVSEHDRDPKTTLRKIERDLGRIELALDVTDSVVYDVELATGEATQYGPTDRLFGVEPAGVDEFVSQVVHPDDRDEIQSLFEAVRRGDTDEFDTEFRAVSDSPDGRWFRLCGSVRESEDTGARRLVGTTTDVSGLKLRERELRRHNDCLEAFARVVSHDLRNPLETASGRLELLQGNCDSEHIPPIERALDRIERIVDEALTLAEGNRRVDDRDAVDVGRLAERCWQTAGDSGATLRVEPGLAVLADRDRVAHVFENLFTNAVEHGSTSPGSQARQDAVEHGDDVTVRVGALDDGSGFYVADDGPGIPEDERDDVFEFGYTTSSEGSGLGLGIVREVAADHGWTVSVTESAEGGARFEVTGVELLDTGTGASVADS